MTPDNKPFKLYVGEPGIGGLAWKLAAESSSLDEAIQAYLDCDEPLADLLYDMPNGLLNTV